MTESLRLLIVDDSEDDARLMLRELRRSGYKPVYERVESAGAMRGALSDRAWDLILSDYIIPGFGGLQALLVAKQSGLDLPFILLSSKADEETLVEAMRAGAADFVMKDRLDRLGLVVKRELADAAARRGLKQAQIEWRTAFDSVRDAIFIHDADFRIVRANLAYAALGGLPIAEVAGKLYWEVFPKTGGPLPGCVTASETLQWVEEEIGLPAGEKFLSRSFPISDATKNYLYSLHVLQDVTERNRARESLEQSERRFRSLIEHASDLVAVVDVSGKITYISPSVRQLGGYEVDEVLGKNYIGLVHPEDAPAAAAGYAEIIRDPSILHKTEFRFRKKDGDWTLLESIARNALADPLINGIVINSRDVTERKQAQENLAQRERYYRKIIEGGTDVFFVIDRAGTVVFRSESGKQLTGWETADVLGTQITDYVPVDSLPLVRKAMAEAFARPAQLTRVEMPMLHRDGTQIEVEALGRNLLDDPDIGGIVVTAHDITERKRAEAVRAELAAIVASSQDAIYGTDLDGIVSAWNRGAERLFGYSAAEMIGRPVALLARGGGADETLALRQRALRGEVVSDAEAVRSHKDGSTVEVAFTVSPMRNAEGRATGISVVARDISGRKRTERALRRSNRALRTLSAGNETLIHAQIEQTLLQDMCRMMVEVGGFRLAWIVYAEHRDANRTRIVAHFGFPEDEIKAVTAAWGNTEYRPTVDAIRTCEPRIAQNLLADSRFSTWHEYARSRGCGALMALPLKDGSAAFGALAICAAEHDAFDAEEVRLLTELADDLAFGILTLRTRADRDHLQQEQLRSVERLKAALIETIGAVALTVEKRDPYTAGHQQRVAELCMAIGRELDFTEDRLEGLRIGATIHDIGKIYVPAEILNRPGKLSAPEFEIIKSHPQVGYDIIKDVKFPWPVTDMILQHHERLDGSGYPQGMKAEQIILEARIIAVADVVEAMSSHRPYRPGLGIAKALAEIERGRGSAYDPVVADACLKLFREKNYAIPP